MRIPNQNLLKTRNYFSINKNNCQSQPNKQNGETSDTKLHTQNSCPFHVVQEHLHTILVQDKGVKHNASIYRVPAASHEKYHYILMMQISDIFKSQMRTT